MSAHEPTSNLPGIRCGQRARAPGPSVTLQAGTRLGPYEIAELLGVGGMGEVYRARDTRIGRSVAIKVISPDLAADASQWRRLEHEARAVGSLSHPNILAIHDVGEHLGAPFLVSELLEGETLRRLLAKGPLAPRRAADIARQVAEGLAAAHAKGIIHRDIKPENLFVTREGGAKILDFGVARRLSHGPAEAGLEHEVTVEGRTRPGIVFGTYAYMAPEQARGEPVDARSDVFALGAVLYEMLSGVRAFARDTSAETLAALLREELPDLSSLDARIPPLLARVVGHCLEKEPARRFQAAQDVAFALAEVSVATIPSGASQQAVGLRSRRRLWSGLLVAGLAVGTLALGWIAGQSRGSVAPPGGALRARAQAPYFGVDAVPRQRLHSGGAKRAAGAARECQ